MTESFIFLETILLMLVYAVIFAVSARSKIGRYFLVFIGCLFASSLWLMLTEFSLIIEMFPEMAGRSIRPTVNRGILLFGGIYFLIGSLRKKKNGS